MTRFYQCQRKSNRACYA